MKFTHRTPRLATSLAMIAALSACGGGGGSTDTTATSGTVKVSLTDAPACGYDKVNVTVNKVRIHRSADAADNDGEWVDITLSPARKINLLDLTNGVLSELGQATLPAGRYTQVRLVLDPNTGNGLANSVVLTGSTNELPLDTPSAVRTGIKLVNAFDVEAGKQAEVVMDFDACKSIVTKGNGAYALKPVVKIVQSAMNGIEGYIDPAMLGEHVRVTAQQNGTVVGGTSPDPQTGRFLLSRLAPGDYDVVMTAENRALTVIAKVPVAADAKTTVSTNDAPISLQAAATPERSITGTLTLTPAATEDDVAYVAAKQSFASGPTVTVKYRGADVSDHSYTLEHLPTVAPQYAVYSTTLPLSFSAKTPTPGTAKYTVEAGAVGYQTQSATVDVSAANGTQDFTLVK